MLTEKELLRAIRGLVAGASGWHFSAKKYIELSRGVEYAIEEIYEDIYALEKRVSSLEKNRSMLNQKISGLRQIVARGSSHHETCGFLRFKDGACDCGYDELMDHNR